MPFSLPPSLSHTHTQLTSGITSSQTVCNGLELVVISSTASIGEWEAGSLASVIVEGRYGSSARTSLRREGAGVNACPQSAENISAASASAVVEKKGDERGKEGERERERERENAS